MHLVSSLQIMALPGNERSEAAHYGFLHVALQELIRRALVQMDVIGLSLTVHDQYRFQSAAVSQEWIDCKNHIDLAGDTY